MKITEIPWAGYEKVVKCEDPKSGLRAIISVHDTTLGPALGGLRMWPYLSEQEALTDVNRRSQGMTYKSAVAETGLGGGKAVIIGNPKTDKSEALFRAMGRFVESLGGLYTTAEDVGTNVQDMVTVRKETKHVTGLPRETVWLARRPERQAWHHRHGKHESHRPRSLRWQHHAVPRLGLRGRGSGELLEMPQRHRPTAVH